MAACCFHPREHKLDSLLSTIDVNARMRGDQYLHSEINDDKNQSMVSGSHTFDDGFFTFVLVAAGVSCGIQKLGNDFFDSADMLLTPVK